MAFLEGSLEAAKNKVASIESQNVRLEHRLKESNNEKLEMEKKVVFERERVEEIE